MSSTIGTIRSIKRISTHETLLTPFSKVVFGGLTFSAFAIAPSIVSCPTARTTAVALPLTTVLPMNARLPHSVRLPTVWQTAPDFSTGSLSPVRLDWLRNRSFARRMRTSAGSMSPADSDTMSPTTISSSGITFFSPSRVTQTVV